MIQTPEISSPQIPPNFPQYPLQTPQYPLQTPQKSKHPTIPITNSTKQKYSYLSYNRNTSHIHYKKFKKSIWTKQQDQLLKNKVNQIGPIQWAQIANFLHNRSGKQCRQRWHNHLREGVTKKAWNSHQYWILALCVRAFGRKWSAISEFIPGRSDNTIKNQWNCKMKPYKQQFQYNIDQLLRHSQCWNQLSVQQQTLLKIINKNKNITNTQQNQLIRNLLSRYCYLIQLGFSQYQLVKKQHFFIQPSDLTIQNQNNQDIPGQLSGAISAGQCIFYQSDQENPILPFMQPLDC